MVRTLMEPDRVKIALRERWAESMLPIVEAQFLYGFSRQEVGVPEDVRQYFSLLSRRDQAKQRMETAVKEVDDYNEALHKVVSKVTQTGSPIVARMPNGETYVMYRDSQDEPTVEKVNVVNL